MGARHWVGVAGALFVYACSGGAGFEGNVCSESLAHTDVCMGQTPSSSAVPDAQCVGQSACLSKCNIEASCAALTQGEAADPEGFQSLATCENECSGTGTVADGGSSSGSTGSGSGAGSSGATTSSGGYTGSSGGTTSSSGGGPTHPLCVSFASVYCGCYAGLFQESMSDCESTWGAACESSFARCSGGTTPTAAYQCMIDTMNSTNCNSEALDNDCTDVPSCS